MPGFAVLFEAGAFASLGVEAEAFAGGEGFGGEDVPDVERDDVGEEDVDVVDGVGGFSGLIGVGGLDIVSAGAHGGGALDLSAPQALAGVEDEVVTFAVAPGAGDTEAQRLGLQEKGCFREFSSTFGIGASRFTDWGGLILVLYGA